jgi:pimeloyl-ACP methyl ester carboxylesterase
MKHIATVVPILVLLACGGAEVDPPPAPVLATHSIAGPGVVAASDGTTIAYTVYGEGSPALVFVHGWMCDQSYWSEQIEPFSASHTVVTVDLPGHGSSGMDRASWKVEAFGGDVKAVVEHLGLDRVILIGHSMGGPVALEAAVLMPEKTVGAIGVDALHDVTFEYEQSQIDAMVTGFETDFAGSMVQFVGGMFHEGADPALIEGITKNMTEGPPEIGAALIAEFGDYDSAAAMAAVAVPVRSINADLWPTDIEANRAVHADYDAVVIPDVGHFLMMESPDVFNKALEEVVASLVGADSE